MADNDMLRNFKQCAVYWRIDTAERGGKTPGVLRRCARSKLAREEVRRLAKLVLQSDVLADATALSINNQRFSSL
jgi:hypothetical protein